MNKNLLENESSPYLQQHAHNPVHWHPWGKNALNLAKTENKPIFLSIGYSACHWCHVMEKESFMDEETAEILNAYFISIKVDREERPDVDHIYMSALQSMSEHAGWPLSMFLTPNAEPFYGGTYYPKVDTQHQPSFKKVLKTLAKAWENDAQNILTQSRQLTQHLKSELNRVFPLQNISPDFLQVSIQKIESYRDKDHGGYYSAPKFPQPFYLNLLIEALRDPKIQNREAIEKSLHFTLHKMSEAGIYDQIAGGFHRYSTDAYWYLPHFEKMLYDNALLAPIYFEAGLEKIGREIIDYILREMTHEEGAFFSSTDADSDGVEGRFFIWSRQELKNVLGEKDGIQFAEFYSIDKDTYEPLEEGNSTPPHTWFDGHILVKEFGVQETSKIQLLKQKLYTYRNQKRNKPFRDEKILTSWNGLAIQALCVAYEKTGEKRYLEAAKKAVSFLMKYSVTEDHLIYATCKDAKPQHAGTLEDFANFTAALIALHRASGEPVYIKEAREFCHKTLELFWDEQEGYFFYTFEDPTLIARAKNIYDHALPSPHSVVASNLFYLARIFSEPSFQDILDRMLVNLSGFIEKAPHAVSSLVKMAHRNTQIGKDYVLIHASEEMRFKLLKKLRPIDILLTERDRELDLVKDKLGKKDLALYICTQGYCESHLKEEAILSDIG